MEYKGFFIIFHQDLGLYAIYRKTATALTTAQAVNIFCSEDSCKRYIDNCLI